MKLSKIVALLSAALFTPFAAYAQGVLSTVTCTTSNGSGTLFTAPVYALNFDTNINSNPRYVTFYTDISRFRTLGISAFFEDGPQECSFTNDEGVSILGVTVEDVQAIASNQGYLTSTPQAYTVVTLGYKTLLFGPQLEVSSKVPTQSGADKAAALAAHKAQGIPLLPSSK